MKTVTLTKITVGAVAGVAAVMSLAPGSARADGINIGVGELQECTISKSMDSTSTTLAQYAINGNSPSGEQISYTGLEAPASDGDVDGRDFLVWQRGGSLAPAQSLSDVADDADATSPSGYNTWRTNFGRTY